MTATQRLLRALFHFLYHQAAPAYDAVAAFVSLGLWLDWTRASLPFVYGDRVLELGSGPGHLQAELRAKLAGVFGLDESPQMIRIARRRLLAAGIRSLNLVRAAAGSLPFSTGSFHCIVATFPSAYIVERSTLAEARRVLGAGGRLVLLPMAWHTGRGPLGRLMAWLFRVTGESAGSFEAISALLRRSFEEAGFSVDVQHVTVRTAEVLLLVATKPG